jgi:hypothetical protein
MTGGYDQANEEIVVYISNRHPKDILRSLAHEMTHHVQKCEGKLNNDNTASTSDPNYIMHDEYLKKIEADAFERGNITFREWEATKKGGKQMNEEKSWKEKMSKAGEISKKAGYKGDSKWPVANKIAQNMEEETTVNEEEQLNEEKEVEVNQALKDSHTYVPQDRALADAYNKRDERIFNDLLKKFGIKK